MATLRLSHIGLCVAELERSISFYCEVLGFQELSRLALSGEAPATLLQVPGGQVQAVYLERDGMRIELLYYQQAGHEGGEAPRPMNRAGLTHLSFRVVDLDATVAAVLRAGGHCLEDTRVNTPEYRSQVVFVTDPDGTRIELLQAPGDINALPGS